MNLIFQKKKEMNFFRAGVKPFLIIVLAGLAPTSNKLVCSNHQGEDISSLRKMV